MTTLERRPIVDGRWPIVSSRPSIIDWSGRSNLPASRPVSFRPRPNGDTAPEKQSHAPITPVPTTNPNHRPAKPQTNKQTARYCTDQKSAVPPRHHPSCVTWQQTARQQVIRDVQFGVFLRRTWTHETARAPRLRPGAARCRDHGWTADGGGEGSVLRRLVPPVGGQRREGEERRGGVCPSTWPPEAAPSWHTDRQLQTVQYTCRIREYLYQL